MHQERLMTIDAAFKRRVKQYLRDASDSTPLNRKLIVNVAQLL